MLAYLSSFRIRGVKNPLFIVFAEGQPVEHLGLRNISSTSASLDQVMKAVPEELAFRHKGLLESAILAMADWSQSILGINVLNLEVLSSNFAAFKLNKV